MIGRVEQVKVMQSLLQLDKSYFLAVTGRRRVGKTYLIDKIYKDSICFRATGIQDRNQSSQILNFTQKLTEYSNIPIVTTPANWQETFILFKKFLQTLPSDRKHIIFLDELPWMATVRSGFIQMLAHLWNDYLSKEKQFVLVICGSATSWINKKILNDKGGFHNRVTHVLKLKPFTLAETKAFLKRKNVNLTDQGIAELYMTMGGIPFYLENVKKGESVYQTIERQCFSENGLLHNEYDNLYKALFDNPDNHEAIIKALASVQSGLTRTELIKKAKIQAGGPYTRAMDDLIQSGFVAEENPFGKKKRGSIYRLIDEYSIFYNKFIRPNRKASQGIWAILSNSQKYKIWTGYAFENLCLKHISEIKRALGISNVYTEVSAFRHDGNAYSEGFQIDLVIDRRDHVINLCECKYYSDHFVVSKAYGEKLRRRKTLFREKTKTKKSIFTTMITNYPLAATPYSIEEVDSSVTLEEIMK